MVCLGKKAFLAFGDWLLRNGALSDSFPNPLEGSEQLAVGRERVRGENMGASSGKTS